MLTHFQNSSASELSSECVFIVKAPITPQMHRYATLWNANIKKWQ